MKNALDIMELKLDPDHEHFARVLSAKTTIIGNTLTTTARVDEGTLKKKQTNKLAEILKKLRETDIN